MSVSSSPSSPLAFDAASTLPSSGTGDGREEAASRTDFCLRAAPLQEEREAPESDAGVGVGIAAAGAGTATSRGTTAVGAVGGGRDAAVAEAADASSIAEAIDEDEVDIAFTCAGDSSGDDPRPPPLCTGPYVPRDCCCCFPPTIPAAWLPLSLVPGRPLPNPPDVDRSSETADSRAGSICSWEQRLDPPCRTGTSTSVSRRALPHSGDDGFSTQLPPPPSPPTPPPTTATAEDGSAPFSTNCALARLLSALGFGKEGGETSGGDGGGVDGEGGCHEEDDHDEGDGDTDDNLTLPALSAALSGLLGVDLYMSAVLHGDGAGGDGAVLRRW